MSSGNAAKQEVWRLFVAVDLPDDVKERMERVRSTLARAGWKARWTKPETMHLTLRFFGNQPVDTIESLTTGLREVLDDETAFELRTAEMGAFPNLRRPRVIWLGVRDKGRALARIAEAIEQRSRSLGIEPEEHPFSPHLTVARVNPEDRETITDVGRHFEELNQLGPIAFQVDHATLYRSQLSRSGAIYSVVDRIDFEANS